VSKKKSCISTNVRVQVSHRKWKASELEVTPSPRDTFLKWTEVLASRLPDINSTASRKRKVKEVLGVESANAREVACCAIRPSRKMPWPCCRTALHIDVCVPAETQTDLLSPYEIGKAVFAAFVLTHSASAPKHISLRSMPSTYLPTNLTFLNSLHRITKTLPQPIGSNLRPSLLEEWMRHPACSLNQRHISNSGEGFQIKQPFSQGFRAGGVVL
jgi:hypothetical protein